MVRLADHYYESHIVCHYDGCFLAAFNAMEFWGLLQLLTFRMFARFKGGGNCGMASQHHETKWTDSKKKAGLIQKRFLLWA